MKTIKGVFIFLILLLAVIANAQRPTVAEQKFEAGQAYTVSWTDIDSLNTYYSGTFDITKIDAQTMYLTYDYVSPDSSGANQGGVKDTLALILEGMFPPFTTPSYILGTQIDTVFLTNSGHSGRVSFVQQTSLTVANRFPQARWKVVNWTSGAGLINRGNQTLKLGLYAPINDYVAFVKP